MKIAELKLEVVRFASEDVIATSAGPLTGMSGLFFIPSSSYSGYSGSAEYVQFNGKLGQYSGGNYAITGISNVKGDDENERADLTSGGTVYLPDLGITIPNTVMAPFAQQSYDAFSYGDGQYYTNGNSYYNQYWQ